MYNIAPSQLMGEGTNAWGRRNYLWLDVDTLLRWIILITPLGSLAFSHWGSGEGLIDLHGGVAGNCRTRQN